MNEDDKARLLDDHCGALEEMLKDWPADSAFLKARMMRPAEARVILTILSAARAPAPAPSEPLSCPECSCRLFTISASKSDAFDVRGLACINCGFQDFAPRSQPGASSPQPEMARAKVTPVCPKCGGALHPGRHDWNGVMDATCPTHGCGWKGWAPHSMPIPVED